MQKVLLITSDFSPRVGGVATYYSTLQNNVDNLYVLTSTPGDREPRIIRKNWHWKSWPHYLPLLWIIPNLKLKIGFKFLAAGEILPIGTVLLLIKMAFGFEYLVFLHGLDIALAQKSAWKKMLTKLILQNSKTIICNSEFTNQLVLSKYQLADKIKVLYPVVPKFNLLDGALVQEMRQKYSLEGKTVLLSVARLVKRKGIGRVIKVMSDLINDYPDLVYVVVGDGAERTELESRITNHESRIIFTGQLSGDELKAMYVLADIFVLTPENDPIDIEGFGIVYLEAQSAGLPIIASRVGGVPEAVGEAGILVNDDEELKSVLLLLLNNPSERKRLGQIGQERVAKLFNPDTQAELFNEIVDLKF
ncbi:MAG: glycosyltransferase family 4 protein [Patescibacteria group bacterium]